MTLATLAARTVVAHQRALLADALTPLGAYRRLAALSPLRFLLESVTGGEHVSRYSFLGAAPSELLLVFADRVESMRPPAGASSYAPVGLAPGWQRFALPGLAPGWQRFALPGAPLDALRERIASFAAAPADVPFTGGWVGCFDWDLVRLVEPRLARGSDAAQAAPPVAILARFDTVVVFDHARQRVLVVANEIEGEVDRAAAEAALDRVSHALTAPGGPGGVTLPDALPPAPPLPPAELDGAGFQAAVRRAKEHIAAGDVFQVVLARRFRTRANLQPLAIYRALRMVNPSPYMVLLELPHGMASEASPATSPADAGARGGDSTFALVGASPEMLLRVEGTRLEYRPIAGTLPRGADAAEDARLAAELLADAKERAEHLMLVDLGRNDLGRVALPGSVRVQNLMEVERYSHVMHLVSSVTAELAPGRTALDALLACFPAGTVSGAPKVRAMEIIDALEPGPRGPYAGAVGYLGFGGDLDTCITIRTLVVRDGEVSVTAGAGIVADSDPTKEQRETENKAAALLQALSLAQRLEHE